MFCSCVEINGSIGDARRWAGGAQTAAPRRRAAARADAQRDRQSGCVAHRESDTRHFRALGPFPDIAP
ncbi:hypothetical protein BVIET440_20414 [Burkholderia vietnamiensis]